MKHQTLNSFNTTLELAVSQINSSLNETQKSQFAQHWQLVKLWNVRVNLTAILDDVEAAWLHYRDSLEGAVLLPKGEIIDFGSGAGFPGIPLAIALTQNNFTLLEPRLKRVSFLETCIARLGITNTRVICGATTAIPDKQYDAGVTRATFSSVDELLACKKWILPNGILLAYRSEISEKALKVHSYNLLNEQQRYIEIY
ncbi:MAG: 16S rRNA (guanine(527)-N(7))-methyltransferase RsmG [Deltaproteobacteria bacterium]|nr:16S rRNA (guanine(527)-N(7))-methyltransferase RsmG [Deltaproteobacteria bacterium]